MLHDAQAARAEFALDLVLPFCAAGESSHIKALAENEEFGQ